MPRGMPAHQFDLMACAVKLFRQEPYEGFIGSRVYWRRCHLNAQFATQRLANLVS